MAEDLVTWDDVLADYAGEVDEDEGMAAARAEVQAEREAYAQCLAEVRRARDLTQVELARRLNLKQGTVSKLERQSDLYVSSLRRYVEALGGRLEVRAVFDDGGVVIDFDDFEHVDQTNPEPVADPSPVDSFESRHARSA